MDQRTNSEEQIGREMPSKRWQGEINYCSRTGKRLRPVQRQKHLYLVLDDWEHGFTIRKIDADNLETSTDLDLEPCVLRLWAPAPCYDMNFTALRSNICWSMSLHMEVCWQPNISPRSSTRVNRWSRFASNFGGWVRETSKSKPKTWLLLWEGERAH
jgi:hypothetical protein